MQVRRRKSSSKSKEVPQVQVKRSTSSPSEPQIQVAVEPQPNVSTEVQLEGQPQVQVEVDPQPDVITQVTQPEVEENEWEIPNEVLDDQWHQILIQAEDTCRDIALLYRCYTDEMKDLLTAVDIYKGAAFSGVSLLGLQMHNFLPPPTSISITPLLPPHRHSQLHLPHPLAYIVVVAAVFIPPQRCRLYQSTPLAASTPVYNHRRKVAIGLQLLPLATSLHSSSHTAAVQCYH
nr:uncharacterized protein LOC109167506 [Ipomoea trifida]